MFSKIFNRWSISIGSLLVLCILLHTGYTHFNGDINEYFWGGLWPEFSGFFFDVVVVIFVIDRWKAREERKLKIISEKRLREHLGFFLDKVYIELKKFDPASSSLIYPDKFHGDKRSNNRAVLNAMINLIQQLPDESDGLKKIVDAVRIYCKRHLHFIECLVPIAAQLENNHFKAWARISFYMGELINDSDEKLHSNEYRYSDKTKLLNILKNINRFDEESSVKKIFNGAAD